MCGNHREPHTATRVPRPAYRDAEFSRYIPPWHSDAKPSDLNAATTSTDRAKMSIPRPLTANTASCTGRASQLFPISSGKTNQTSRRHRVNTGFRHQYSLTHSLARSLAPIPTLAPIRTPGHPASYTRADTATEHGHPVLPKRPPRRPGRDERPPTDRARVTH
ncbi:PREDICTED: uncharacterized protein LOC106748353 [Dinoponera quadriceps]|uniref:Uncharacterized protein LOC106748353 n=1 Tax=Dinoponera quadriceps TaxID=609295 RepID=A0A6P3XVZ7_DINQU|nr:PREDICTED: uncharacterized protein LOC106748353 [Dinoponera quadriceps]